MVKKILWSSLPYLTLPCGDDVLPPSAEASNGPNAHPWINRKVTKSPSAVLTWVHTNTWNYPPPKWGPTHFDLPTNAHSQYLQENVSLKAHKHIHPDPCNLPFKGKYMSDSCNWSFSSSICSTQAVKYEMLYNKCFNCLWIFTVKDK